MPSCIDRFSTFSGMVVVIGWSSDFSPGGQIVIDQDGEEMQSISVPVQRPDVAVHHGSEAVNWGFRAYGITKDAQPKASRIGLRFPPHERVGIFSLPRADPPEDPHTVWRDFINNVNNSGGTVLEIGSRARSGNINRNHFGPHVKYIGMDITAGPNVDIVGDAHHLSDCVHEVVDFVYSISTFEHLLMPWKVALEINKVLRLGGKVFSHSHQSWPGHDEPWDYFRFSREGWGGLFNAHTGFQIIEAKRGEFVSVISHYNIGEPYEDMEYSPGHAMSVCIAEKTADSMVRWDANMSAVKDIKYDH